MASKIVESVPNIVFPCVQLRQILWPLVSMKFMMTFSYHEINPEIVIVIGNISAMPVILEAF